MSLQSDAVMACPVRVELPTFDPLDVDTWVAMCENLMVDGGLVLQATKFRKMLAKLPAAHFRLVKDLAVQSPLADDCYEQLKMRLRRRLELTSAERLQHLENLPRQLGSKKPSELYNDLAVLYPNDTDHEIIREVFLCRMPTTLQLMCREWLMKDNLRDVSLRADAYHQPGATALVTSHVADAGSTSDTESDQLVAATRRSGPPAYTSTTNNRPQHAQPKAFVDRWCRLHRKYGPVARKCLGSCSFTTDMSGNGRGSRQ